MLEVNVIETCNKKNQEKCKIINKPRNKGDLQPVEKKKWTKRTKPMFWQKEEKKATEKKEDKKAKTKWKTVQKLDWARTLFLVINADCLLDWFLLFPSIDLGLKWEKNYSWYSSH